MKKKMSWLALIGTLLSLTANAGLPPTTSKVSGDTGNHITFNYQFPNFTGTHSGATLSLGVLQPAGGGLGSDLSATGGAYNVLFQTSAGGAITVARPTCLTLSNSAGSCRNYIQLADFENNSTTGWSLGTTGTLTNGLPTGSPTFGSGAAGTLSIAAATGGNQLAGTYSLSYAESSGSGTTAGNMVATSSISVDTEDQSRVLAVQFYYRLITDPGASNRNFSGTSSNSFAWAAYDVTNSAWLQSTGNFCMIQSTGAGYCTGTITMASSTANFRFVVYNANATGGATTLYLDDFYVGQQNSVQGPARSDMQSYTVTITGSVSNPTKGTVAKDNGQWGRDGDMLELRYDFQQTAAGSGGSGTYLFSLPAGLVADTNKIQGAGGSGLATVGAGGSYDGTNESDTKVGLFDTTHVFMELTNGNAIGSANAPLSNTTARYSFVARIPIAGWSSNVTMSQDSDTRVVAAKVRISGSVFSLNTSASLGTVGFDTVIFDTHSAFDTVNHKYICPVTGYYRIEPVFGLISNGTQAVTDYKVTIAKNGSTDTVLGVNQGFSTTIYTGGVDASVVQCNAGDDLKIQAYAVTAGTAWNLLAGASGVTLAITRLSGPAVVAASESVNAHYHNTATSISGSLATISWTTSDFDSHSGMSAGTYTLPVSGKFEVNSCIAFTAASAAAGNAVDVQLQKNGSVWTEVAPVYQSTQVTMPVCISDLVTGLAGDTIRIQASSGANTPSITSSNSKNFFSIVRVGN